MSVHPTTLKTYASRVALHSNPTAKKILETMERKQSNLCVSVDVTKAEDALEVVRRVGKSVCMVKVSSSSAPNVNLRVHICCTIIKNLPVPAACSRARPA